MEVVKPQRIEVTVLAANREIKKAFVAGYRGGEKVIVQRMKQVNGS